MTDEITEFVATAKAARPFGLSERELDFAFAYIRCGNTTEAALDAGYAKTTAEKKGYLILRRPHVMAFLRQQLEEKWDAEAIGSKEIIARLAWLARGDKRKLFNPDGSYKPVTELDEATAFCIRGWEDELKFAADGAPPEMTRKVKFADPHPPLRTLAQIHQLLAPDVAQLNVFINMDKRLDAAHKRNAKRQQAEDAKILNKQD
jgi:hypothetical protein